MPDPDPDPNPDPPSPAVQRFLHAQKPLADRNRETNAVLAVLSSAIDAHGSGSPEHLAARQRLAAVAAVHANEIAVARQRLMDHLHPGRPPVGIQTNLNAKPRPYRKPAAQHVAEAVEFVSRLVPAGHNLIVTFVQSKRGDAGGARTADGTTTIDLPAGIGAASPAIHELGHAAEDQRTDIGRACRAFLSRRVGDEKPVRLNTVARGLPRSVVGRKDRFDRMYPIAVDPIAAYYVGTEYPQGGTEVFSHGLAEMYNDPVRFATVDPDWFHFMLATLNPTAKE